MDGGDQGLRQVCCTGCLEIRARCCVKLGRWRQAREALECVGLEVVGAGGVRGMLDELGSYFFIFFIFLFF